MRRSIYCSILLVSVSVFMPLLPCPLRASDARLEKDLQQSLTRSKALLLAMERRLAAGEPVAHELAHLRALGQTIQTMHNLLLERFRKREGRVFSLGEKAAGRHNTMMQRYLDAIEGYLRLLEGLPPLEALSIDKIRPLRMILDEILPEQKAPLLGSLPYRHLDYPRQEPLYSPAITPAFRGGEKSAITPEDTKGAPEGPISKAIAELAKSLSWNPVNIYEWVKNTIETEWYWGCMKGAEGALRQKSGNDADQAALLVALLRACGFPTRYVRGVIEFFPDIEWAKHLTGIEDERELAAFFQHAGIPYKTVIAGGRIATIQIEHIFVETFVPYANYRGAIIDEYGKVWLALDTSIKVLGYEYNEPRPLPDDLPISGIRDVYLEGVQALTPLDYTKETINDFLKSHDPSASYEDLVRSRTLIPEVMKILPASLQFKDIAVTNEYTRLPAELLHKVRFTTAGTPIENTPFFDITIPLYQLSNRSVAFSFEPESVEDQGIINAYGGLANTPAYLVRLRPVLTVNEKRMAVGTDGLPMGADFTLTVDCISPRGRERITNTHIMGNLAVMGIVAQKAVEPAEIPFEEKDAERLLYDAAINYIHRWNEAEEELAFLLHLSLSRPLPTLVTLGGVIDVTYLLDTPHGFDWKGVYVDADLRVIECACGERISPEAIASNKADARKRTFMQIAALQGSVLESTILEEDFQVGAVSTARLFGIAQEGYNDQPSVPILSINNTNLSNHLPSLLFPQNLKEDITGAVSQGLIVRIPEQEITYEDWTGIGYIKEDPETGEAGYILTGMIAGAMTAWAPHRWPEDIANKLEAPFSEPAAYDPESALYIQKITATDLQQGIVGEYLSRPLQAIVKDKNKKPVAGAEVIFSIKAGGGSFDIEDKDKTSLSVKTDRKGIASARLIPGKQTSANPTMWWDHADPNNTYPQQVGENVVDAALSSGVHVTTPFTAFGFPGEPHHMEKIYGDGFTGQILTFAGFIAVSIEDIYGNPLANLPVDFVVQDYPWKNRQAVLIEWDDPCMKGIPLYGDCNSATSWIQKKTSSAGASVHVILGDKADEDYCIDATWRLAEDRILTQQFTLHTLPFRSWDWGPAPAYKLFVHFEYLMDRYGNPQNAGKAGSTIPLTARLYLIKEEEEAREVTLDCDGKTKTCTEIIGNRQYFIDPNFRDPLVMFGDQQGVPDKEPGKGFYTVNYTLSPDPNVHRIEIRASASTDVWTSMVSCAVCDSSYGGSNIDANSVTVEVFGVDIEIEPTLSDPDPMLIVPIDPNGYLIDDYTIAYTIQPEEYRASIAYVVILHDDKAIAFFPSETQGRGTATIARGSRIDPQGSYEVGVLLNAGTEVEIRSAKIPVQFTHIYIEKKDPEFPDLKLRWDDYYPELGSKVITLRSSAQSMEGTRVACRFLDETRDALMGITPSPSLTCEPIDERITGGRMRFRLSGMDLAPRIGEDPSTGIDAIGLLFYVEEEGEIIAMIPALYRVRNNANTDLSEVLQGEGVCIYDDSPDDNHRGETGPEVTHDSQRRFDFVQEMLNQVLPRKRGITDYTLIDEDGIYDDKTVEALLRFKTAFSISVNTTTQNMSDTVKKLMKDYEKEGEASYWLNRIIDKETCIGRVERDSLTGMEPRDHLINGAAGNSVNDTGLYELYDNVVKPFIHRMITEAERYAGLRGAPLPTDNWVSRTGEGAFNSSDSHGPGMSYCFGCKDSVEVFNDEVVNCPPEDTAAIRTRETDAIRGNEYRGNINGETCAIGTSDRDWAGLYAQDEYTLYSRCILLYDRCITRNDPECTEDQRESALSCTANDRLQARPFSPQYWSGIDCSGLAQRSIESGRDIAPGLKITVPSPPAWIGSQEFFTNNSRVFYLAFPEDTPANIQQRNRMLDKLKKGDLIRYDKHISIVYSDRPNC